MEGQAGALTQKVMAMALEGDSTAMRLCMERLAPLRRGRPVRFDLPVVVTAGDVNAALGSVLQAVSTGVLTPEEAQTVAGVLEVKRRAVETTELASRVDALEAAKGAGAAG